MFVLEEATILHADCDAFFASVAQRDDPSLRGLPVAVGPGIVMAATYEARAFGVRSAMPAEKARRLCPGLVVVNADFDSYVRASRQLFRIFRDTAPVVEGMSLEEAFLDVRGLGHVSGHPVEIAMTLRKRVREEIGLPLSVGVARTKGVAKMASKMSKPEGLLAVSSEGELPFLHPLRVERLWGVGKSTAEKLHTAGIETVGEVAAMTREELEMVLGRACARSLHAFALGRDPRRVRIGSGRRSVGSQRGLGLSRLPRRGPGRDARLARRPGDAPDAKGRARRPHSRPAPALRRITSGRRGRERSRMRPPARSRSLPRRGRWLRRSAGNKAAGGDDARDHGAGARGRRRGSARATDRPLLPALDRAVDKVRERFGTDAVSKGRMPRV